MEIQDRNNMLYQLLGNKLSGTSATSVLENGFVDILKSYDATPKASEKIALDVAPRAETTPQKTTFEDAKSKSVSFKNVENSKKDIVKDSSKTENKPAKEKVRKEKTVSDETAVSTENATRQAAPAEKVEAEESVATVETEQAEAVDAVAVSENSDMATLQNVVAPVVSEMFVSVEETGISLVAEGLEQVAVNNVEILTEDNAVVVEEASLAAVAEKNNNAGVDAPAVDEAASDYEIPMTDEEFLLMRQAKYLDDNIVGDKKLKINVSVQEEKIAAPVAKDVLHNRFEIDAVLRKMDNPETLSVADEQLVQTDVADNTPQTTVQNSLDKSQIVADTTVAATLQASDDVTSTPVDAVKIAAVGKEAVAEIAGTSRTEAFARINETSSRDVYKGMGKEVVEQIKVNITKSAVKGVDTVEIQLKPEDLGKIQIKMHISKDGRLQAEIISGRQETLDMLQKEISGLVKAFDDAGYETDSRSFSFNFQDENQAGKQQNDESGLLKFIGDALEQEADGLVGNDNYTYDPALGLNIRV